MEVLARPAALLRYQEALDAFLRDVVGPGDPPLLYHMMGYHLGWEKAKGRPTTAGGGKALRPTMCLLACEAVGGDWRQALPAAGALELVHNFSLIHDDIQDHDRERRHRPTVWVLWGQGQAINAGDGMLALAHLALLRLAETSVPAPKVMAASKALDAATLEMIGGQCLDLSFEKRLEVALDAYLEMIAKKTGALFGCALELGALAGCDDAQAVAAFARCGRLLGLSFQARDDMLGIWGAEAGTGKPVGADIRRKKKSLPIVYALTQAQGATRDLLFSLYGKHYLDEADVEAVLRTLDELGAAPFCRQMAMAKKEEALAQLAPLGLKSEAAAELKQVAEFLLERDF
ncbi:MAG TPA: polyprenyl synthetase family protein [Dehalococcoidia bacterium]|nr:polyprenyl synthetase family protein [Dehalococcoidia bacterium]